MHFMGCLNPALISDSFFYILLFTCSLKKRKTLEQFGIQSKGSFMVYLFHNLISNEIFNYIQQLKKTVFKVFIQLYSSFTFFSIYSNISLLCNLTKGMLR